MRGILNSSLVHPREVFLGAITASAAAVVLVHNHPSGDPTPSADDRLVPEQLVAAGRLFDIPVHDQVIVGRDRYLSFAEAGLLFAGGLFVGERLDRRRRRESCAGETADPGIAPGYLLPRSGVGRGVRPMRCIAHYAAAPRLIGAAALATALLGGAGCEGERDRGTVPAGHGMIRVSSPAPGATVTSPLRVVGEARGSWFFEASFPIRLLDAKGREIAAGQARAEGEWMTERFVPFEATLQFRAPVPGTLGTLVLARDSPSGLPENADEVRVPARF